MAREMTTDQVRDFLGHRTRTAKVATVMQDGRPHVMPVWFVLDGEQLLFTTGADSVKGRNLRRDPRIALLVDDETPPYAFVHVRGRVTVHEDPDELLRFATAIGARYWARTGPRSSAGATPSRASSWCGSPPSA